MSLTPQDVRAKLFTSVRFKHGYDEDEVDAFLDEVERALAVLHGEVERLSGELATATAPSGAAGILGADTASVPPTAAATVPSAAAPAGTPPAAAAPAAIALPAAAPAGLPEVALTDGNPSPTEEMLRRTLLIAQRTADAVVAEARTEAASIVAQAREQVADAERAASAELEVRLRKGQREQEQLSQSIEQLRAFEQDFRGRLRAYLQVQLQDLEGGGSVEQASVRTGDRNALDPVFSTDLTRLRDPAREVMGAAADAGTSAPPALSGPSALSAPSALSVLAAQPSAAEPATSPPAASVPPQAKPRGARPDRQDPAQP